ncbi:MAG TPA: xanthine dehydrogenase family protein molybdopterin-binding subunit [Firmicutes bacterium]|nr:xanthine dehydrogenase family protein molybdopterin-binding subunit [Bacillota bacterium]
MEFINIGKRVPKLDAWDKVQGKTMYIHDVKLPRMLHGKILWSKYPHARIVSIDTSKAEQLPGVRAVITGYNTPEIRCGFIKDNPVLKKDKVRQYRDEVAAVAADTLEIAEKAVKLIDVAYEELPAVFDPEEAMQEGAPLIHEDKGSNVLKLPWKMICGDVEEGRKQADYIVEETFRLPFVTHCCLGTSGCVAQFDAKGNLTVYSPTQIRFLAHKDFQEAMKALGLKDKTVKVIQTAIGGGFGSKLDTYPFEFITIMLAYYSGRAVKLVYTREEEFFASPGRQPVRAKISQGCTREGKLTFRDIEMILDNGAYTSWGATTPSVMMMPISSLYQVPNIRYVAKCVHTNNIYSTAMRGYGNPQATFAIESQIDTLAEKAGFDPWQFRMINRNRPGEVTPQKFEITSCGMKECLEAVKEKLQWDEKRGKSNGRGVGIASLIHVGGGARIYKSDGCGTILKLDDFGKASLLSSASDMGQGSDTILAMIVAEELGLNVEDVTVIMKDTDLEIWDAGAHASRSTFVAGNSALYAARKAKEEILEFAATMLKEPKENLYLRDRKVFSCNNPEATMDIDKLLRAAHFRTNGRQIVVSEFYDPPTVMLDREMKGNFSAAYTYGVHGVEVEVDQETGQIKILKYIIAMDVGRALNPMAVEGQLEGGGAMGLGYSLMEELHLEKGKLLNGNFLDYKILTFPDMPNIDSVIVETIDEKGPFGAKGIGEPPLVGSAPAIANAVWDAVGVRIRSLPITPEKIVAALEEKQRSNS